MPRVSDAHREARRAQVLDAARRCFAADGFHQTSMDDVIRASGLSAGAVYQYFRSKDDLIVAAAGDALSQIRTTLETLGSTQEPPAAAVVGVLRTVPFVPGTGQTDVTRLALHGWGEALRNTELHELVRDGYATFRVQISATLRSWQERGAIRQDLDPDATTPILLSIVLGYVVQRALFGDEVDPAAFERGITDLLGA